MAEVTEKSLLLVGEDILPLAGIEILENSGFKLIKVRWGSEAVDAVRARPEIDLVLVDLEMAGEVNSFQLGELILQERDLPLLFLASVIEHDLEAEAEKITPYGVILKGGSEAGLIPSITMALRLFALRANEQRQYAVLRKETDRLRLALDVSGDGIWEIDLQTDEIFFTPNYWGFLGYGVDEPITIRAWLDLIHLSEKPMVQQIFEDYVHSQSNSFSVDFRLRSKNGDWRWVNCRARAADRNLTGHVLRLVGTFSDITDQKNSEIALERVQNLLAETQRLGKVGGWEFDMDTGEQVWTEEIYRIHEVDFSYKPTVEGGIQFYTDLSLPKMDLAIQRAIEYGESFDLELDLITAKGNQRWVHAIGRADLERRRVFGFFQDVSEQKRAEQALREGESKFLMAFEQAAIGIAFVSLEGRFVNVNPALCHLLEYSAEELCGLTIQEITDPADHELDRQIFETLVNGVADTCELEKRYISKRGRTVWVTVTGSVVKDEYKRPGYIIAQIQDITTRKIAEADLHSNSELLQIFLHYSPIYAFIKEVTPDCSRILYASNNYINMIGVNGAHMVGKTNADLFEAEFAAKITADDWAVVANGQMITLDEELNDRSYTTIKFPIVQGERKLLAGYTIDITARKQSEEDLRANNMLVKSVLDSLTARIAVLDRFGVVLAVNEAWRKDSLFNDSPDAGYSVGAKYLSSWEQGLLTGDLIACKVDQGIRDVLAGNSPLFKLEYPVKVTLYPRWFAMTVMPLQDSQQGVIVIREEITERKEAEQLLMDAQLALESTLAYEKRLARTDMLTGVYNRRYLYELAQHEFEVSFRYQQPLSVMMVDIDHFKRVNDTYGHSTGDEVLREVIQLIGDELRTPDVIGRYGGEEFIVILPMTAVAQAYVLAERIRTLVENLRISAERGDVAITVSIGVVEKNHLCKTETMEILFQRADDAMYVAKQTGRNRTVIG